MPKHSQNGQSTVKGPKDGWIFIANDEAINADCDEAGIQPSLCKLRHPRSNSGVIYLFSANGSSVCEVNCFTEKYRSWLIGDSVHSDGSIYITSPVDPLFLVLPYLVGVGEKKSNRGKFRTLDQVVYDEDFPDCHRLLPCCSHDQLSLIADSKDLDDSVQVYQYSQDRTLRWLKSKTEMLANALEEKKISVDTKGSHSAIFARSKNTATSREDYLEYAHGIISDYLSSDLEKQLRKFLELPDVSVPTTPPVSQVQSEPPNKKAKLATVLSPTDDYSLNIDPKKDKSKNAKLTVSQKKLSKIDKSGMKSISSFFSPKSS